FVNLGLPPEMCWSSSVFGLHARRAASGSDFKPQRVHPPSGPSNLIERDAAVHDRRIDAHDVFASYAAGMNVGQAVCVGKDGVSASVSGRCTSAGVGPTSSAIVWRASRSKP